MPQIVSIEVFKGKRESYTVTFDDQKTLLIIQDTLISCGLKKGQMLTENERIALEEVQEKNACFQQALRFLEQRHHAEGELKTKLAQKGFHDVSITFAISKAHTFNYLNDETFTDSFIRDKQRLKRWGKNKILFELQQKNIFDLSSVFDEGLEEENAYYLATKKQKSMKYKDDYDRKLKLKRYLVSKGFTFDTIDRVLKNLSENH